MKEEIWKDINNYEGLYQVSSFGNIKSFKRHKEGRLLKPGKYSNGYLFVHLCNESGVKTSHSTHRLVAEAFIPNPNNLPQVNHKNGIKTCNEVWNLEWCTASDNMRHTVNTGLVKNHCKIIRPVLVKKGRQILSFDSMSQCSKYFDFTKCWLGNYIKKHGNPCIYNGFEIYVMERGDANVVR